MRVLWNWWCLVLAMFAFIPTTSSFECWFCDDNTGACPDSKTYPKRKAICDEPGEACFSISPKNEFSKRQMMLCADKSFLDATKTPIGDCEVYTGRILFPVIAPAVTDLINSINAANQQAAFEKWKKENGFTRELAIESLRKLENLDIDNEPEGRIDVQKDESKYAVCACQSDLCMVDYRKSKEKKLKEEDKQKVPDESAAPSPIMTSCLPWISLLGLLGLNLYRI